MTNIQRIYNSYKIYSTPKYFLQVNEPPTDSTMSIFKLIQSYFKLVVTHSNELVMICRTANGDPLHSSLIRSSNSSNYKAY